MKHSYELKIIKELVEQTIMPLMEDKTARIEYYAFSLYRLCLMKEKEEVESSEELNLLYNKIKKQILDLEIYVQQLSKFVLDDAFKPYFHDADVYIRKIEEQAKKAGYTGEKELPAYQAWFFFEKLLETHLPVMNPEFISFSKEEKLKRLEEERTGKQRAVDKALKGVYQKKAENQNKPMEKMQVVLHVYEKEKKVNVVTIEGTIGHLKLGRGADNDLQIKHMFIATHSGILHVLDKKVIFETMDTKRTQVNHQKLGRHSSDMKDWITKVELQSGDVITLGNQLDFYVDIIETKTAQKKNCLQCGAEFITSKEEQLCFDCRREIAMEMGFDRKIQHSKTNTFAAYRKNDLQVTMECVNGVGRICYNQKEKLKLQPAQKVSKKEEKPQPVQESPKKEVKPIKLPGDVIPGYKKLKLIGKGGMGEVYLVKERKTGKELALKRIIPQMAVNPIAIDTFIREAYIHGQLDHKNVAKVYEVAPFENQPYILMEFYKDGTLLDYCIRNQKNPEVLKLLKDALIQILEGLDYLHNLELDVYVKDRYDKPIHVKGLVHRDLKPENVFVQYDEKGNAVMKIADMGLAKSYELAGLSGVTQGQRIMGSFGFMCRQQTIATIASKPEVDIWAAVASIYYLLTAKVPKPIVPGDTPQEQVDKIMLCKSVPIQMYNPMVPTEFAKVIDRALDDMGPLYYQKARDLINDLKKVKL